MRHLKVALASIAVVLLCVGSASGQIGVGPSFSLDDNPAMPITSPPGFIPGYGAEDPYGWGTYGGPIWAPSPSLPAIPAMDAEILVPPPGMPFPVPHVVMSLLYGQPFGYVDAVSRDSDKSLNIGSFHLSFSVDRISKGIAGSAVGSEWAFNQQPGDIYRTQLQFQHPVNFAPILPMVMGYNGPLPTAGAAGGTNFLVVDESQLNLTAGNPPGILVPPGVPCPPIMRGTHDNADAVEFQVFDVDGDQNTDTWMYFSVAPDEMLVSMLMPQDIYCVPPGLPAGAATQYADGFIDIGLIGWESDNIDALVVWEDPNAPPGVVDPGMDYALFSLSHGSVSLNQWGLTESDILFTNFTGAFWLFARGGQLGLMDAPGMMPGDNVDALETLYPGDANLDDCVDGLDYVVWSNNYSPGVLGKGWLQGDFNGDGTVDGLDYVAWSNNYQMGCPVVPTAVPEPASALVLTLGLFFIRRRSRA